jgi:hypothetical protein
MEMAPSPIERIKSMPKAIEGACEPTREHRNSKTSLSQATDRSHCSIKAIGNFTSLAMNPAGQEEPHLLLKKHPDKTAMGRTEKGFDFLGYHFVPVGFRWPKRPSRSS